MTNKAFNSTVAGQMAMCRRGERIALLHMMNEAIRRVKPGDAYDRAIIDSLPDDAIDSFRDGMIVDYNNIAAKKA